MFKDAKKTFGIISIILLVSIVLYYLSLFFTLTHLLVETKVTLQINSYEKNMLPQKNLTVWFNKERGIITNKVDFNGTFLEGISNESQITLMKDLLNVSEDIGIVIFKKESYILINPDSNAGYLIYEDYSSRHSRAEIPGLIFFYTYVRGVDFYYHYIDLASSEPKVYIIFMKFIGLIIKLPIPIIIVLFIISTVLYFKTKKPVKKR
jgi:hypothetical protein